MAGIESPKRARIDKAGDSVTEVEPAGDQLAEVLDARDSRASRGEVEEAGTIAAHVANARHGTGTGVEESRRRGGRRVPESRGRRYIDEWNLDRQ